MKHFNIDDNDLLCKVVNIINKYKVLIGIVIFLVLICIVTSVIINDDKVNDNNNGNIIENNNKLDEEVVSSNTLILKGEEVITIYRGTEYIEPGYEAYNIKNQDISSAVTITSNFDIEKIGEYQITYKLYNIIKTRTIKVVANPNEQTTILLNKVDDSTDVYLMIGESYVEPGYEVINNAGLDLKDKVKIEGNVDNKKVGTYELTYSLIDPNENLVTATRKIIVMDINIKLTQNIKENTNKDVIINIKVEDNYFDYIMLPNKTKIREKNYNYTVKENGTYTFASYNKSGYNKKSTINITNIDKTPPTGSCSGFYKNGVSTINVKANDNVGIDKYILNGKEYKGSKITINSVLKNARVKIYDKAGNYKDISCNLESKNSTLEMHFIASGPYDDAILIRTSDKTIFIDGGRWYCREKVTPYLKALGVKKIDVMIGSHLHFNHIQMQADILDNFSVGDIYYPDDVFTCKKNGTCEERDQEYIVSKLNEQSRVPIIASPGKKVVVGEIELYFIGPETIKTFSDVASPQNYNSSIMILKFYDNTFMFTGDAANPTLDINSLKNYANRLGISLNVDLLKYPHHGNATLKDEFLNSVNPEYSIVPNYSAPQYPAVSNINKLKNFGVEMYRQSDSSTGNIFVFSDGKNITIKTNVAATNYK